MCRSSPHQPIRHSFCTDQRNSGMSPCGRLRCCRPSYSPAWHTRHTDPCCLDCTAYRRTYKISRLQHQRLLGWWALQDHYRQTEEVHKSHHLCADDPCRDLLGEDLLSLFDQACERGEEQADLSSDRS